MSGTSYDNPCPNCGQPMNFYSDYKPFDHTNGDCINCGFYLEPKIGQMTLKELNYQRKDYNEEQDYRKSDPGYLKPFKKLPKCNLNKIW